MTTTPERFEHRPSTLSLVHVRMPPGCAPSSRPERPFMVHAAYYRQGNNSTSKFVHCVSSWEICLSMRQISLRERMEIA